MADFLFVAYLDNSLSTVGNWVAADSSGTDLGLGPSGVNPGPGDNAWFGWSVDPSSGTLVCDQIIVLDGSMNFLGGTYTTLYGANLLNGGALFGGGNWNCVISDGSNVPLSISGGNFNLSVDLGYPGSYVSDGDFIDLTLYIGLTPGEISPGSVSGTLTNNAAEAINSAVVTGRMTLDGGSTFFYSPNSTYAAAANKVLTGTNNLGVAGSAKAFVAPKLRDRSF